MRSYPHMCRDGHQEIGHADSETETCPLCEALNQRDALRKRVEELERVLRMIPLDRVDLVHQTQEAYLVVTWMALALLREALGREAPHGPR